MILVEVRQDMKEGFFAFFDGRRRFPGDKFPVEESQFSKVWMRRLKAKPKSKADAEPPET